MTPVWPLDLPLKLNYGLELEFSPEDSKVITPMEGGNTLRRERWPNPLTYLNDTLKYNDTQFERFKSFYMDTLRKGTRKFYAPVVVGTDIEIHLCSFGMPSLKASAVTYNRWEIQVLFEIRDVISLGEGTYWFIGFYGSEYGEQWVDQIDHIINIELPGATNG